MLRIWLMLTVLSILYVTCSIWVVVAFRRLHKMIPLVTKLTIVLSGVGIVYWIWKVIAL